MAKFELTIENSSALSFIELREIVAIIDDHIAQELRYTYRRHYGPFPPFFFEDDWPTDVRDFSFVEIESARSGSIILTLALGGVAVWGLTAVALGLRRSRLGRELSRLGENAGNILADGLGSVNDRLEDWSEVNQRLRKKQTKVTLKRIEPDSER